MPRLLYGDRFSRCVFCLQTLTQQWQLTDDQVWRRQERCHLLFHDHLLPFGGASCWPSKRRLLLFSFRFCFFLCLLPHKAEYVGLYNDWCLSRWFITVVLLLKYYLLKLDLQHSTILITINKYKKTLSPMHSSTMNQSQKLISMNCR